MKRSFLFLTLFLLAVPFVSSSLGVTPGAYTINFQPGFKGSFPFTFMVDAGDQVTIYAEGDLAQYVKLTEDKLSGSGAVVAILSLPETIPEPGVHRIYIGAQQGSISGAPLGIVGDARGVIIVNVPYPGRYVETTIQATDVNEGESVELSLTLTNRGSEMVTVSPIIEIYSGDEKITTVEVGVVEIEPTKSRTLKKMLDTTSYKPGSYKAMAIVTYDDQRVESRIGFRIGTLFVDVVNYSNDFVHDKINRMEIDVASSWNDPIDRVYANVTIVGTGIGFITPSISLSSFETSRLTGFFDTTTITTDPFEALIVLHYLGKTTEKTVTLHFYKPKVNYMTYALIGGAVLLILALISTIIIMRMKLREARKK